MHLAPTYNPTRIRVRRGDTLGGLSRRYHVSIAKLKRWNRSSLKIIRIGQTLVISPPGSGQHYNYTKHNKRKDRSRNVAQSSSNESS